MRRRRFESGTPWEDRVGYSRAVRVGDVVVVSGTTGTGPDGKLLPGGAYEQARRALENVVAALQSLGATPSDVVRTRMFIRDIRDWEEIGRAHAERFGRVRPATSMVEVSRLIERGMLVEIEADALVRRGSGFAEGLGPTPRRRSTSRRSRAAVGRRGPSGLVRGSGRRPGRRRRT